MVKLPLRWEEAAPSVVPILRGVTAPVNLWRSGTPLRFAFLPGLHLLLALDQPGFRVFLSERHLEQWGVSAEAARHQAWSNLDLLSGLVQRDDGIWQLHAPDGNASARITVTGWLRAFSGKVDGQPIAAIPTGRHLLVGGEADATRLYAEAESLFRSEGEAVSPCLYTPDGPYLPADPKVRILASNAERWFKGRLYRELGERLEEPMATYKVVRRLRDGICVSFCHFQAGVLLPVTDVVMLPGDVPMPFEKLRGPWSREEDLDPPCLWVDPAIPASVVEGWKS